jgi:hypothetical protein
VERLLLCGWTIRLDLHIGFPVWMIPSAYLSSSHLAQCAVFSAFILPRFIKFRVCVIWTTNLPWIVSAEFRRFFVNITANKLNWSLENFYVKLNKQEGTMQRERERERERIWESQTWKRGTLYFTSYNSINAPKTNRLFDVREKRFPFVNSCVILC